MLPPQSSVTICSSDHIYPYTMFAVQHNEARMNDSKSEGDLDYVIVLHGGAGSISKELDPSRHIAAMEGILLKAFLFARDRAVEGIGAVDIVEYVVKMLEEDSLFNAGVGAVFTRDGTHELEASIMDGNTKACGASTLLSTIQHPIQLARHIMTQTPHVCLGGSGAESLSAGYSAERVENSFFSTSRRKEQLKTVQKSITIANDHDIHEPENDGSTGTVGCVCMYRQHVAAATSTGGMTNKFSGRIGDTTIIGAGNNKSPTKLLYLFSKKCYQVHMLIMLLAL